MSCSFDDPIGLWWCLGTTCRCTVRCTPSEAIGIWSVLGFYTTVLTATIIHGMAQHSSGTVGRNEQATRRHTAVDASDDWQIDA